MYIKDINFKIIKSTRRKLKMIFCELKLRWAFLNKKQKAKTIKKYI